jgi:hypothetical protein
MGRLWDVTPVVKNLVIQFEMQCLLSRQFASMMLRLAEKMAFCGSRVTSNLLREYGDKTFERVPEIYPRVIRILGIAEPC